ncbi:MAG: hypothetical protein J6W59_03320, partial [Bacteroidales bacterium]|nr:hypothetical protein [Bacteroidales bacterium]
MLKNILSGSSDPYMSINNTSTKMNNNTQPNTLLQLMEILSEKSDDSRLSDEFWADNQAHADELAKRLSVTPLQAVLLSICLRRGPRNVDFDDIASHLAI